ncbi:MAG: hypothetical protein SVZ03_11175 [Spirochaetota bacterium]|nr:hypothetical protein [Spirochaetota bacterium]
MMMKHLLLLVSIVQLIISTHSMLFAQLMMEEEKRFHISGFMQTIYIQLDVESENSMLESVQTNANENGAFVQSDLNLYFSFFIDEGWKAFSEVAFCYKPTGELDIEPETTQVIDSTTGQVTIYSTGNMIGTPYDTSYMTPTFSLSKYGAIEIERAYIEWNKLSYANLRFGRYFTPFGIWQRDHGAPIVTSARLPLMVVPTLGTTGMPKAQTGVELLGSIDVADTLIEYAAYVGNGISEAEALYDDNSNKAVGGFLNFKLPTIADRIDIEFGGSGYYGKRTYISQKTYLLDIGTSDLLDSTNPNNIVVTMDYDPSQDEYTAKQWDTMALAHLKLSIASLPLDGTFILQAEGVHQWSDKDDDIRIVDSVHGYNIQEDDMKYYSYYGQVEYQFYGKLTPYFRYETTNKDTDIAQEKIMSEQTYMYVVGINYKPRPKIAIKAEANIVDMETDTANMANYLDPTKDEKINNDMTVYVASISVAF